jgi:hypothetical protein
MVEKRLIPVDYQQKGNVCLLASYSIVLGYYKHIERGANAHLKNQYLIEKYLDYMIEQSIQYDSQAIREMINDIRLYSSSIVDRVEVEDRIHKLLLYYCCNIRPNIRGYLHIKEFDDYMRDNAFTGFPVCYRSELKYNEREPVEGVHQEIITDLESNHSLAMIFMENHSVVIGRGDDDLIYLRDTNDKKIQDVHVESFTPENYPISEYMFFCRL